MRGGSIVTGWCCGSRRGVSERGRDSFCPVALGKYVAAGNGRAGYGVLEFCDWWMAVLKKALFSKSQKVRDLREVSPGPGPRFFYCRRRCVCFGSLFMDLAKVSL
jgi:hypothetical protein